ncbi:hypothetical protein [Pseudonocardia sp.]|uniref:hypothetical protein n=1 Tax=Pseudonocardia sp. TaxID=60912 RepID=UPI003D0D9300
MDFEQFEDNHFVDATGRRFVAELLTLAGHRLSGLRTYCDTAAFVPIRAGQG